MTTIVWRRLDLPGHDAARVVTRVDGAVIEGSAVFADDGRPCRFDYAVTCDAAWRTTAARVTGWIGQTPIDLRVAVADGRWTVNGQPQPQLDGCVDVDLSVTPATNLLPIRRLALAVGASAPVRSAWLRHEGTQIAIEVLEQTYTRVSDATYHYESQGGSFVADLQANDAGFVTAYPGLWEAVASA